MKIGQLIKLIRDNRFKGISCNSKSVKNGFVFLAIKGADQNGGRFIKEALANGAKALVCDLRTRVNKPQDIPLVRVNDTRLATVQLALEYYRHPSEKLRVIGITGTCGKTTVTYLLEAILKEAGFNPAVIGTVNYRFKNKVIAAKNTTPGPLELQCLMADMLKVKTDYVAMEVSSHALEQGRVLGTKFHSAIFTNLTQDHLDYHKTINHYFIAKSRLFSSLCDKAFAVLNYDDQHFPRLKNLTRAEIITYGLSPDAQIKAENIKYKLTGSSFLLSFFSKRIRVETPLIGKHNVYNILAASAWAYKEGLGLDKVIAALSKFRVVPGRMEPIISKKRFLVFVDYAHTEDALKNALISIKNLDPKRIITLFGCGGERDRMKRPKMGRVASSLSDFVIITNDNPRSENPNSIIRDIEKGIRKDNYVILPDRKKAIKQAVLMAKEGDIILIAGKGHEEYQILRSGTINFDDRKEVRLCLK
ncbi:MAG: UDP-N-acetylmuramoyl-L-alanyl-D-glutamate--2,6-diaminopimelate ligase [Candidatus Omnitrophica bacterium]|nr:UDP-N-acetylmuramoyl-L-alanyl-D-glutamate--2,6-diaminopimelate ligase [Candidatus Omnitrophota bacterium]